MADTHQDRVAFYRRYADRMERRLQALDRQSSRLGWARLAVVAAGAAAAWGAFSAGADGWGLAAMGGALAVFWMLARVHRRVERSRRRHRLWQHIKEEHGARLRHDWDALPPPPLARSEAAPPPDEAHPFASDLDLTGPRSLLRLIDTCATEGGSRRLRRWLLARSPRRERTLDRQALVRELAPLSSFRDRLTLEGHLAADSETEGEQASRRRWSDRALHRWLEGDDARADEGLLPWIVGLGTLGLANVVLVALHWTGVLPPIWGATLPLYLLLYTVKYPAVSGLFDEVESLQAAFRRLRAALRFLEERPLAGRPGLQRLCAPVRDGEQRPSHHLRRVTRLTAGAAITQKNEILALLNALVPWDLFFAHRLRQERQALAEYLPRWLDVWYRLEALSALAALKDRRPASAFPDIADEGHRPVFEGEGLGHPLLPEADKVRNSFRLAAPGAIALITGSNMAGKSTFLRTLGLNLSLAFAGGPVDAHALRTVPFRLFTCINVSDAVTGGLSYFYAEVRRLKALMEALNEGSGPPLFFLVDEIFRGTNNRERLIGSRAYLRALAEQRGTGAVATHDLELTELANEIAALENYHFREEVNEGGPEGEARMTFDYTLRRGPCPTTNALKIMRAAGLPTGGFAAEMEASLDAARTEE